MRLMAQEQSYCLAANILVCGEKSLIYHSVRKVKELDLVGRKGKKKKTVNISGSS